MASVTDYHALREIDRRLSQQREDLHLFMQEERFYRKSILARLDKLERRRTVDIKAFVEKFWVQIVMFFLLLTGNTKLIELVQQAIALKK